MIFKLSVLWAQTFRKFQPYRLLVPELIKNLQTFKMMWWCCPRQIVNMAAAILQCSKQYSVATDDAILLRWLWWLPHEEDRPWRVHLQTNIGWNPSRHCKEIECSCIGCILSFDQVQITLTNAGKLKHINTACRYTIFWHQYGENITEWSWSNGFCSDKQVVVIVWMESANCQRLCVSRPPLKVLPTL